MKTKTEENAKRTRRIVASAVFLQFAAKDFKHDFKLAVI